MNSNDPNKLAFKGDNPPWYVRDIGTSVFVKHDNDIVAYLTNMNSEKANANAHLVSAAPEAIEFIADLVYALSNGDDHLVAEMIPRAEEILKKAYNH